MTTTQHSPLKNIVAPTNATFQFGSQRNETVGAGVGDMVTDLGRPVTLGDLQNLGFNLSIEISTTIGQQTATLMNRMDSIVAKVNNLETRQDKLEENVKAMEGAVHEEFLSVREEIQEQKRRIMKMTNIVLMGVPETAEGGKIAENVLRIIAPHYPLPLRENRVGDPNGRKPRPLRVTFLSTMEKTDALRSCKKLANHPELKSISVRKDLTKVEQQEWQERRARTGMVTRKRKSDEAGGNHQQSKKGRTREDDME